MFLRRAITRDVRPRYAPELCEWKVCLSAPWYDYLFLWIKEGYMVSRKPCGDEAAAW